VRRAAGHVDVIHAHWWLPAGLVSTITSGRSGVPVVITCHGSDVELLGSGALARIGTKVLATAAVVGAVSAPLAEVVTGATGAHCRVLRMPLPLEDAPRTTAPPGPPWRLLCVGRLSPEKGFDIAVKAVGLALEKGLDLQLRIIGEGPMHSELAHLAAAVPGGRVSIDAPVGPAQLAQAIAASHVLLAPSRHEGLGLVALEALGRGRPVIASAVGGLVDVVVAPEDGVLVPADDAGALAAALGRLPLPAPIGDAVARHAPGLVAEEHRVAYQDALGAKAGRRVGSSS
jgi:glycogen synthase